MIDLEKLKPILEIIQVKIHPITIVEPNPTKIAIK